MEKDTQAKAVNEWLLSGKPLTSVEAIERFGCTRLSAKVCLLRKKGYNIISKQIVGKTRYGTPCIYVEYKLIGKGADVNE